MTLQGVPWAEICGLPHEWVDDDGLGIVLYSREEYGEAMKVCESCREIKDDVEAWLAEREAA